MTTLKEIMAGVRARQQLKAENDAKLKAAKSQLTAVKRNLALRARFLSVTEKAGLIDHFTPEEETVARLADEENWQTDHIVIMCQHQICACGGEADATVGLFAKQQHKLFPSAWRLRQVRDIPPRIPLHRSWTTAHIAACPKCTSDDICDDILTRFDTVSTPNDQLTLWS